MPNKSRLADYSNGQSFTATIFMNEIDNALAGYNNNALDGDNLDTTATNYVFAGLQMNGAVTVGADDTGYDVQLFGATSGKYMLWDESDDALEFTDSTPIKMGTGGDATIQYDGTNLAINPRVVGSGAVSVTGALVVGTTSEIATLGGESSAVAGIAVRGNASHASFTGTVNYNETVRAANAAFNFCTDYASTSGDLVYKRTGAGVVTADGSFTGGGADPASMFESTDGTTLPVGATVVLVGDKVRVATGADDPEDVFGVVRPDENSVTLLMNAAPNKWDKKYEKTDFGAYVLDENGDRVLNEAYDEEQEYVPRTERPEWNIIGLLDQIPITKGYPTNPRWQKMKDISPTVELWYVR